MSVSGRTAGWGTGVEGALTGTIEGGARRTVAGANHSAVLFEECLPQAMDHPVHAAHAHIYGKTKGRGRQTASPRSHTQFWGSRREAYSAVTRSDEVWHTAQAISTSASRASWPPPRVSATGGMAVLSALSPLSA